MTELEALCERYNISVESEYLGKGKVENFPDETRKWHVKLTIDYHCSRNFREIETEFFQGSAVDDEPMPVDVLYCLLSDAQGIDNCDNFEEWADNFGYDSDSRKAEAIYKKCVELAPKLHDFLGELYDEFARAEH